MGETRDRLAAPVVSPVPGGAGRSRRGWRTVRGFIRRRLLVNALVDPEEASARLPDGVSAHVTALGTVVGCCMLEIDHIRPVPFPSWTGVTLRAAAHRISVDLDDGSGRPITGVYVPIRHTDSRLASASGGRWFPGVHRLATLRTGHDDREVRWTMEARHEGQDFGLHVVARTGAGDAPAGADTASACDIVGSTCLRAPTGVSPDHNGELEGVHMLPDHLDAELVEVEELRSSFIDSFTTAGPAPSFLMQDVNVTWLPATSPVG